MNEKKKEKIKNKLLKLKPKMKRRLLRSLYKQSKEDVESLKEIETMTDEEVIETFRKVVDFYV